MTRRLADRLSAPQQLLLGQLRRERALVFATVGFSLGAALFEGASVGLLVPLLGSLQPDAPAFATGWNVFDRWVLGVGQPPSLRLYQVSAFVLASILLRSAFGYGAQVYGLRLREQMVDNVRRAIFDQLGAVSLRFYAQARTGDLVNTATTETVRLGYFLGTAVQVFTEGFKLVAYVVLAFMLSWKLTLVAVGLLGAVSVLLRTILRQTRQRSEAVTTANGDLSARITEFIHGIRTVVSSGSEEFERSRFYEVSERVRDHSVRTGTRSALARPVSEMLAAGVLIGIVVVSVRVFVFGGALSMGALLTFLFALFRLVPIVQHLNNTRSNLAANWGSINSIALLLSRDDKPYLQGGTEPVPPLRGELRFEDVSFGYDVREPVLKAVSLAVPAHSTVAFVGASGSGKSTLMGLVPRFFDPTHGRVLLDGVDLREFRLDALRARIATVSQDTFLFNDTVANNIAYGLDGVSLEQIRKAARQANALEFIEAMPRGFETTLGERGTRLSGGQRQRIAIARAILRDPEVLILDEATSALDSVSEQLVQKSLERLTVGRTVLVIAHRLSTVRSADHVVVLEGGRIVEQGTYDGLVGRRGRLSEYHDAQFATA